MNQDRVAATRATYDRVAVDYDRRTASLDPAFTAFRTAFAAAVEGPVVDLGCGPGRDVEALRGLGVAAFGVDLSAGMLAVARTRGLPVVQGDLRRPPVAPGSPGGLWCNAALLHVLLNELPPRDRLVLTMIHIEERSIAETAELVGWSQVMVKVQAFRARKKLKDLWQRRVS